MAAELSPADRLLIAAVSQADVMDAAGRLLASPRRALVSLGEQVAMALAIERLQAVAIEAELLLRALDLPESGNEADMATKDHAVQTQVDRVREALAALRGETNTDKQETDDGSA